jgi:hypothetical protein
MLAHALAGEENCDQDSIHAGFAANSDLLFFPVIADGILGFRLHDADAAINKVLAVAFDQKVQGFIDLLSLDCAYISLGVAIWAAVGRHAAYTPDMLLDRLRRNSRINAATLDGASLAANQSPVALKAEWLEGFSAAQKLMATIPYKTIGCLYLDQNGQPARGKTFDPAWVPHYGSDKGAWPKLGD